MQPEKIKNKGQARLFENQYLEMLTKTHPLVIWGMYIPIIGWMLYYSVSDIGMGAWQATGIFTAGIFAWTFFEYIMHRFVFHFITENQRLRRIIYTLHGNHHEFPRDRQRLFMPPVPSLLIASLIFGIMRLIMGVTAYAFFPGFILGYLLYGSIHYAIHAWRPPFPFMKPLWRNHHLHHYQSEHRGFGVSSSLWDRIFGTFFRE
ncbi:sterol desaturase family protein [Chitinophaga deserti]|uniref:sterol desaturase family protein n=1 Tax=Chitinophaga deserti TaxID=2164099 RepID=UPI000D6C0027|nr:sterol desaturase family protein [Chitinophaga deserti]